MVGAVVLGVRELFGGGAFWGVRGSISSGFSELVVRRFKREAFKPDRKEAFVMMAVVFVI